MTFRLTTRFRIPTILILVALFFTQSAAFSTAATMTNTWYNAKSTRKVKYSEPSSSRQFARTSFNVQLQGASGDLWQVTLWLGGSYTVVSGAGGNISGALSTNATAFKWDQMGNPDPNAKILTKAWISGIPSGGMRATPSADTHTVSTESPAADSDNEKGSTNSLVAEATLVGEFQGTRFYRQDSPDGDVTLYARQGDVVVSASTPASDFTDHGLTILLSTDSGTPSQVVLLPNNYTPNSSAALTAVGPRSELFVDTALNSRNQDSVFTAESTKEASNAPSSQKLTQVTFPLYSENR